MRTLLQNYSANRPREPRCSGTSEHAPTLALRSGRGVKNKTCFLNCAPPPHQTTKRARLSYKQKQARNRRQSTQHRAAGCAKRSLRLSFQKVCRILLRLRQKISSIEAKEQKLWSFEEGQSISSLESRQAWTRPEPQIA